MAIYYVDDSNATDVKLGKLLFWWFLIIGCKLLAEFQCGIHLCMMDGYNFSSIMLTFYTEPWPLRISAPLQKHTWATIDQCYVSLSFQFQFALKLFNMSGSINEILAFYPNHLLCWRSRRLETLWAEILALPKTYGYFTPYSIHFTEKIDCWLNAVEQSIISTGIA